MRKKTNIYTILLMAILMIATFVVANNTNNTNNTSNTYIIRQKRNNTGIQ